MLKKIMALATTTAMFGANAAAYALTSARAAVKGITGSLAAADDTRPGDGRDIKPSIPPMPPDAKPEPTVRKSAPTKSAAKASAKAGAQKVSKTRAHRGKASTHKHTAKSGR